MLSWFSSPQRKEVRLWAKLLKWSQEALGYLAICNRCQDVLIQKRVGLSENRAPPNP
jgi:hypothetical protein